MKDADFDLFDGVKSQSLRQSPKGEKESVFANMTRDVEIRFLDSFTLSEVERAQNDDIALRGGPMDGPQNPATTWGM
jgi:hypothetical protein